MAYKPDQWGNETADDLRVWANSVVPQTRTTFITDDELRQAWRIIENRAVTRLKADVDINILDATIHVQPGTFRTAVNNEAVIGQGENIAVTLQARTE